MGPYKDEPTEECRHNVACNTIAEHRVRLYTGKEREYTINSPGGGATDIPMPEGASQSLPSTRSNGAPPGPLSQPRTTAAQAAIVIQHFLAGSGLDQDGQIMALAGAQLGLFRRVAANAGGGI